MSKLVLDRSEIQQIELLITRIQEIYSNIENPRFWEEAVLYAHELPYRLRLCLRNFHLKEEPRGICLISGFPVDDRSIGRTPAHWKEKIDPSPTIREEIFFFICGCLLGEPFGWSTQQGGYIMHDICPIKQYENEQIAFGSKVYVTWHTEDAFHPYAGDYVGLMCLRNPTQTPTTVASLSDVTLTEQQTQTLFEPHYTICPDHSHLEKKQSTTKQNSSSSSEEKNLGEAYEQIEKMNAAPEKIGILFGSLQEPYIRIDPYFMKPCENQTAQQALTALENQVDNALKSVVLQPGEICFVDNCRAVHGRMPYQANHDGRDRWLKRLNITRDLRKSRSVRLSTPDRKIY